MGERITISVVIAIHKVGKRRLHRLIETDELAVNGGSDRDGQPARLLRVEDLANLGFERTVDGGAVTSRARPSSGGSYPSSRHGRSGVSLFTCKLPQEDVRGRSTG